MFVTNDRRSAWESFCQWFTYDVHQHGALLNGPDAPRHSHNQQADGDDHHESCGGEEVIVNENAEVVENRRDGGADGHEQEGGELESTRVTN